MYVRDNSLFGSFQEEQWSTLDSLSSEWLHPLRQRCKPIDRVAAYQCVPCRSSLRTASTTMTACQCSDAMSISTAG